MRPRGRLGVIVIATALMLAGIALMRISDSRDPSVTTAAAVHRSDRAGGDALQVSQGNAMPRPHTKSPPAGNPAIAPAILAVRAKLAAESITPANAAARGFSGRSTPWVRVDAKLRVQTYIYTSAQGAAELQSLTERGVKVELVSAAMDLVQGWVPLDALDQVAALPFVLRLTPPGYPHSNAGSVVTQGDAIVRANLTRQNFGLDGTGVRVGVISDGANQRAAAAALGDLPATVKSYGTCSVRARDFANCDPGRTCNEGTAMLEIIHDIAPGAALAIGAVNTSAEFIQRIDDLKNDFGADVIVDDLGFFAEPWFADGPIAQKVASVTGQVVYVSAAGNSGRGHYEEEFFPDTQKRHDFGLASAAGADSTMDIQINSGGFLLPILQWNDPFGGSANDYDLALLNSSGTQLLCAGCRSDDPQTGFQDPIEGLCYFNAGAAPVLGRLEIERFDGNARRLELMLLGGSVLQYNNPAGSIFGHPAVPGAVGVGAIDASDPGNDDIESFSSRGPSRIDFPSLQMRDAPAVAGIDGVSVTGTGGFPSLFFGTSAAAPHVAGVAALLRQALPGASSQAVIQAMLSGAVDLGPGGTDSTFGAGRVDAFAATTPLDTDSDGVVNSHDDFPLDPAETTDTDHDRVGDNADVFPNDPAESRDTDHDGIGDNADPDDDNDGSLDVNDPFSFDPARTDNTDGATIFAAVLPSSRSVQVNANATSFATIINATGTLVTDCGITLATPGFDPLVYQTTDPTTNALTGTANTPPNIPAGASQSFVIAVRPTIALDALDVPFRFDCANSKPAPVFPGINTLLISASTTPAPDIIALVATQSGDGIVHLPSASGANAFAIATVNVGAAGTITASADGATLPLTLGICATNLQGVCAAPPAAQVVMPIGVGATPTFSVFVTANGPIGLDPALHRVVVRFKDGAGVTRGSSSVAVRTLP